MNGLTDFTDWLSPMLVKELRQGVRSRIFVYTLLLLQGSLMLLTMVGLIASDAQQDSDGVSHFFWVLTGAFLILFLPLSGLSAVSSERTANTLELIFLTRLGSRRIVAGKWLAIVAQITLLVFTILPYLVLRYFLGGVDLGWELLMIGGLLLTSVALSAITVGLSPLPPIITRIVFVLGLLICLFLLVVGISVISMGRGAIVGYSAFSVARDGVAIALEAAFVILLMLEFGAARIGAPAENHSSPLRLIGLAAIIAGIIFDHLLFNSYRAHAALFFTLPILIGALCEAPRAIVNIYRPFVRRGIFGKAVGRFLYPGWPSAVPYTLLVVSMFGLELCFRTLPQHRADSALLTVAIVGALLFPAAIIRLFGRMRYPSAIFIGIQAISVLLYSLASALADFKVEDLHPILDLIPTCELLSIMFGHVHDPLPDLILVGSVTVFCVIALLVRSWSEWREIHALEKKAALMNDASGDPAAVEAAASPTV
jgi:hypothetical protein